MKTVRKRAIMIFFLLILSALQLTLFAQATEPFSFQPTEKLLSLNRGQKHSIKLKIIVEDGYHIYQEMFSVNLKSTIPGLIFEKPIYPDAQQILDPVTQTMKNVYEGTSICTIPCMVNDNAPDHGNIQLEINYQGCSSTICYLPQTLTLNIPFSVTSTSSTAQTVQNKQPQTNMVNEAKTESENNKSTSGFGKRIQESYFLAFLFLFVAGILTSFTPCVYPIIPMTITIFGARGAESKFKGFLLSLTYVQGIALTYSILGLIAAFTGSMFGQYLSNPWVVAIIAVIFIVFGLFMMGVFNFNVPASVQTKAAGIGGKGYIGAFLMGIAAGVIAAPCTGPALAGVLTWVATTQNAVLGFLLLYIYAIGIGVLFIVLGTFSSLLSKLPKSGTWMDVVKGIFAVAMFTVALYFLQIVLPFLHFTFISKTWLIIIGVVLIVAGVLIKGLQVDLHSATIKDLFRKSLTILMMTLGLFFIALNFIRVDHQESLAWQKDLNFALEEARAENKPIMIDFYADWCAACKELDQKTYSDPNVQNALERFIIVKIDMTRNTDVTNRYKKLYKIIGLPLVIFYDSSGHLLTSPRITGYVGPEEFLKILQKVK